jgi:hypothetical protein
LGLAFQEVVAEELAEGEVVAVLGKGELRGGKGALTFRFALVGFTDLWFF